MTRTIITFGVPGRPFWRVTQNYKTGVWRLVICRKVGHGWRNYWDEARPEQFWTKKEAEAFKKRLNAGKQI